MIVGVNSMEKSGIEEIGLNGEGEMMKKKAFLKKRSEGWVLKIKPEVARRVKGQVVSLRLRLVVGALFGGVAAPWLPTF